MAVGMAAIPQEAHQAGRHMDRPRAVIEPHVETGVLTTDRPGTPVPSARASAALHSRRFGQ